MKLLKKFFWFLFTLVLAIIFIIVVRAMDSKRLPDLRPWHTYQLETEPLLKSDYDDINSYLKDEDIYIREAFALVADSADGNLNRYNPKSQTYPLFKDDNLNASFIEDPGMNSTKGVILLVHGLTDSPYHMRALADLYRVQGFYVLALRLPGHGTLPSALVDVTWQQWVTATKWGAKQVNKIAHDRGDVPFYMGGFSTGGALVLNYSLSALNDPNLTMPKKLFLFSPAIGVPKMAAVSAWHKSLTWMPYFEKFRWLDVLPEYDPAKYNSFCKNAGRQVYLLAMENQELFQRVALENKQNKLPAMITFQSLVDATVIPQDVIELYKTVGTSKDELFVFDINRVYKNFIRKETLKIDPNQIRFEQKDKPVLHMLINNLVPDTIRGPIACGVYERSANDSLIDVYPNHHGAWPLEFFAMSHVAVPIAPSNKAYGRFSLLGNLHVKGERGVLFVSPDDLMRIRYNPFFDLMSREIVDFIKKD